MVAVHAFAFAVCTLPTGFGNEYHKGDRVVVNKLVHDSFRRGDLVLYYPDWRVTSIPLRCCHKCRCMDCKLYLVNTGQGQTLVHLHQIVGKAYRLTP